MVGSAWGTVYLELYIFLLLACVFANSQLRLWHGHIVYEIGKPDAGDDSELSHTRLTLGTYMF